MFAVCILWYCCGMSAQRIERINVAVNTTMVSAIDLVIENEQVSLTEAVRRLISYGDFVYRAKLADTMLLVQADGENPREVVVL
jgi:hypothetical protein